MPYLLTLSLTFTLEDEAPLDLGELLALVEQRAFASNGVHFAAADIAAKLRTVQLVVEIEGEEMSPEELENQIADAISECVQLVDGPRFSAAVVGEVD